MKSDYNAMYGVISRYVMAFFVTSNNITSYDLVARV